LKLVPLACSRHGERTRGIWVDRMGRLASLSLILSSTALAATLEPTWAGDFETGDLSQWSGFQVQAGTTDRLVVVNEPVRQGRYALRATVRPGDLANKGSRAEVTLGARRFFEGEEAWFHWYTLFPVSFVSSPSWALVTQFHSGGDGVPLAINLHGEELELRVMGHYWDARGQWDAGELWHAPLQRGEWMEFLLHVRFSADWSKGFVELWKDGELVVPLTQTATLDPGDSVYLKQGLYRDRTISWEQTVYHDGMRFFLERPDALIAQPEPAAPEEPSAPLPTSLRGPSGALTSSAPAAPSPGSAAAAAVSGGRAIGGCAMTRPGGAAGWPWLLAWMVPASGLGWLRAGRARRRLG
jgi:hypothetical protein